MRFCSVEVKPPSCYLFQMAEIYVVDSHKIEHQQKIVAIFYCTFFTLEEYQAAKFLYRKVALCRYFTFNFEATEWIECCDVILDGIVEEVGTFKTVRILRK